MFFAAARALAAQVTDADLAQGRVFPAAGRMREVAAAVATAVATVAYDRGLATTPRPADVAAAITAAMYVPRYVS
jgi:malate dehydrogenase (oxaloacetate-decarboxylating)(NADP+)